MFPPSTVFVVGAGASSELGLPLGTTLKGQIRDIVSFRPNQGFLDQDVTRAVSQMAQGNHNVFSDYYHAAALISTGIEHVSSIDNLLNIHQDNNFVVRLGKIAICIAIRRAERNSALAKFAKEILQNTTNPTELQKTYESSWYVPFGELLTQGATLNNIDSIFDDISIVTFNYDRCIEFFAERLIGGTYGTGSRSRQVSERLEVLHAYGQIGPLYGQGKEVMHSFGRADGIDFVSLSAGIKTFTEAVESEVGDRIKQRIREAKTIVFLGFGWLPQNLELLNVTSSAATRIFFTTKGIREADRETVTMDLWKMIDRPLGSDREIPDGWCRGFEERGGCAELLRGHWRQLTRA